MSSVTPAPTALSETGHIDPAAAFVPVQTRSERPRSFDPADFDAPTGREVNWKHTPIAELATVLTDEETESGDDIGIEYEMTATGDQFPESTGYDADVRGDVFEPEDLASAIAWKRCPNALHQRIPAGVELDEPLRVSMRGKDGRHSNGHLILEAMPNSRGTIILEHSGSAQYAQNVEIVVRDGASLTVVSVQEWDDDTVHLSSHQARVDKDASLRHIVVNLGGKVVRVNPSVELAGAGSQGELYGLAFADDGQYLESQVYLFHKGENTTGDVLYKGALQGQTARTTWIGDVLIGPDATGTDSYEANRNLLLTEGARAESIPNLEIETATFAARATPAPPAASTTSSSSTCRRAASPRRRRAAWSCSDSSPRSCRRSETRTSSRTCSLRWRRRSPATGESHRAMTQQRVCGLSELEMDEARRFVVDGKPMAVVLDSNGEVPAIGDTCTHGDISLSDGFVEGESLECWAHGSAFSLRTGRPLNLPAYEPVPVYAVTISGDDVLIDPAVTVDVNE